jgi:hypothetical protein
MDFEKAIDKMVEQGEQKFKSNEYESRKHLINWARDYGIEGDLIKIFSKTDSMLRACADPIERKRIAVAGILEVNNLFSFQGLVVNNVQLAPVDPKDVK